ncbi:MAG TPA: glycoside hydrolase family 15 protein [Roseiflexaceae bacterium]
MGGVRKAADAIAARGPATPQERWEETGGYSPSTLASMIAGLVAAGDLARARGDNARAALYTGVADAWQRNTENRMFTTNGPVGDGHYYVRIDNDGDPNDGSQRDYGNCAGLHQENSVLDAGFLDFVRLGVKAPSDPYIADSIAETDASLATDTPSGRLWRRYTFDGYGEKADGSPWGFNSCTPKTFGRPWPILTGERGEYVVARGGDGLPFLRTMANTANDGYMIPEQVWDCPPNAVSERCQEPNLFGYQFGKATGSASPLAWAMAQYIRLARAIDAGRPVETPAVVAKRYAQGVQLSVPTLQLTAPADGSVASQRNVTVSGTTNAQNVYIGGGGQVLSVTPQKEFRFGGGAGELDFGLASKDTDTRDPNALDVIVGPGQTQSSVLDWRTASPVQLPMLPLAP